MLGGTGYLFYGIWASRNPNDQYDPDPSKKTLLVLGTGWGAVSLLKKLDTENYNVIVVSPRNYFLFTPLLPSCTTGTIEHRSIMEPIRNFLRHKKATVKYYEAEATKIDYEKRVVYINDDSEIKGDASSTEVPFDMLVVGVGAENATFGKHGKIQAGIQEANTSIQVSLVFVRTHASSRRYKTLKISANVLWTVVKLLLSQTRVKRRSSACYTWSLLVVGRLV